MSPADLIRLRHMAEAAQNAIGFCAGRQQTDLDTDAMLRMAVMHTVQIVGEAASKVSDAGRAEVPGIEWRLMTGMRNRLVHAYFDIDAAIVWLTVTQKLPELLHVLHAVPGVVDSPESPS